MKKSGALVKKTKPQLPHAWRWLAPPSASPIDEQTNKQITNTQTNNKHTTKRKNKEKTKKIKKYKHKCRVRLTQYALVH